MSRIMRTFACDCINKSYEKYNLHTDASEDSPAASGVILAAASGDGPADRHGAE